MYVQFSIKREATGQWPTETKQSRRSLAARRTRRSRRKQRSWKCAEQLIWQLAKGGERSRNRGGQRLFRMVNDDIRWVEKARLDAEPSHLEALLHFAARAYRRPLSEEEKEDLLGYYRSLPGEGRDWITRSAIRECDRQRADVAGFVLSDRSGGEGCGGSSAVGLRSGQPTELFSLVEHAR